VSAGKYNVNSVLRLSVVLLSFAAHLQIFVLLASCSSTSGKHSVPCLIDVLSRLKRFPFSFPE